MTDEFLVEYVINTETISMEFQEDYTVKDIRSMQRYLKAMLDTRNGLGDFPKSISDMHELALGVIYV